MTLSVREAWCVLGQDPRRVSARIKSAGDRVKGAEKELEAARPLAKRLLGLHHPDRCPGDLVAAERFSLVQEAVRTLEEATAELRTSGDRASRREGDVFIEVDIL